MIINSLLRPFKNRLLLEDFLRSLLTALAVSSLLTFALSVFYHIRIQEPDRKLLLLCFACSFSAVFLFLFFIIFYPWRSRVARRIDGTGLKDRISTMLEFRNDDSPVAEVQRRNALWYLRTMSPTRIKLNIKPKRAAACIMCFIMMTVMLLTPYDIFARINPKLMARVELEKKIAAMSDQLREEIINAEYPEAVETSLLAEVDNLQQNMLAGANDLQRATSVIRSKQAMEESINTFVSRIEIADAFQKFESTRPLGVSFMVGDRDMLDSAFTSIEDSFNADINMMKSVSSDIDSALSQSGIVPEDGLYSALKEFSSEAGSAAEGFTEEQLSEMTARHAEAVTSQIMIQMDVEDKFSSLSQTLQSIQDALLGYERPEDPNEGVVSTDTDIEEVDIGVDLRERDAFIGGGGQRDVFKGMDEPMYDPELGYVTFGEVYEAYYEKYKEQLHNGIIPEELQSMLDKYFYWLNN